MEYIIARKSTAPWPHGQSPSMALRFTLFASVLMAFGFVTGALADGGQTIDVKIQNHVFTPAEIKVPAGKNVTLHIKNMDGQAEEFDSTDLKIEKVIAGSSEGDVHLRNLDKGKYSFMGEYHSETAKGVVVAE